MNATAHVVLRLPFASPSHEISICFDKAFGYIATTKAAWRFRGKRTSSWQTRLRNWLGGLSSY